MLDDLKIYIHMQVVVAVDKVIMAVLGKVIALGDAVSALGDEVMHGSR